MKQAKRVDVEETSPKFQRSHQVTPERRRSGGRILSRAASAVNDPGVVGPIVWDLRRARLEGTKLLLVVKQPTTPSSML